MSVLNPPLYVEGGHHSGEQMRGMLQDAARRNQGVGHATDLKVTAMLAPTGQVQVAAGNAWVTGVADPMQGTYWVLAPDTTVVDITPSGGVARSDLVVLRVEDPQYEGNRTPDIDSAYVYVIQGVAAGTTKVPAGVSGIPLARIDLPANTAAVTNALIHDVRKVANPRRERTMLTIHPGAADVAPHGGTHWYDLGAIDVPSWAVRVVASVTIAGAKLVTGNYYGTVGLTLSDEATQTTTMDMDWNGSAERFATVVAGTMSVAADLRGSTRHWFLTGDRISGTGDVQVDTGSTIVLDFEWFEGAE